MPDPLGRVLAPGLLSTVYTIEIWNESWKALLSPKECFYDKCALAQDFDRLM